MSSTNKPDPVREGCAEVAHATVHMQLPDGTPPLARILGPELAEGLCAKLSEMLANCLPSALIPTLAGDLLEGAEDIAMFLYGDAKRARAVRYMEEKGTIPTFRIGTVVHARKSVLLRWMAEQEGRALKAG